MQNFTQASSLKEKLFMLAGILGGGGTTLLIMPILSITQMTLVSSIGLASLIVASAYLYNRVLWWMVVGAIAGMILGIGGVLAGSLAESKEPLDLTLRLTFVTFQSVAGLIAGILLGRKVHRDHLPTLKEFLSSLSALTVGLFATIVTLRFIVEGLEPARTLSSRLSVSTTILITLLAIPGAIGYLFANHRSKAANHLSDINRTSDRQP